MEFDLIGGDAAIANAIRRVILSEVSGPSLSALTHALKMHLDRFLV